MLPRFVFPKPSAIEREAGWTGMIFPSITTLIWTGDHSDIGLVDWYVWRTAPVLPYPLESTGTWLPYAQDDAVNFKKVA
jgi:hypothetical protein